MRKRKEWVIIMDRKSSSIPRILSRRSRKENDAKDGTKCRKKTTVLEKNLLYSK